MTFDFEPTITMSLVFNVVMVVVVWFRTRGDKVAERFKIGSDRMDRHDLRIAALERDVRNMPDKDSLHGLELQLTGIAGEMKAVAAIIQGNAKVTERLEAIVTRHEQHLLDHR